MEKSLNDIITEAQADGADLATLVSDLQAYAAANPAPAVSPITINATDAAGNAWTGTLTMVVPETPAAS